jgi:hypothetical protein
MSSCVSLLCFLVATTWWQHHAHRNYGPPIKPQTLSLHPNWRILTWTPLGCHNFQRLLGDHRVYAAASLTAFMHTSPHIRQCHRGHAAAPWNPAVTLLHHQDHANIAPPRPPPPPSPSPPCPGMTLSAQLSPLPGLCRTAITTTPGNYTIRPAFTDAGSTPQPPRLPPPPSVCSNLQHWPEGCSSLQQQFDNPSLFPYFAVFGCLP